MLFCNRDGDQVWNFRKVCYWTSVGAHYFTKVLDVTSVISLLRSYGYFWHLISLDWLQQAPKLTWRATVWTGWIFSSATVLHLSFPLLFSPPPWHGATPLHCASAFSPPWVLLDAASSFSDTEQQAAFLQPHLFASSCLEQ